MQIQPEDLPFELDIRGHGYTMRGWSITRSSLAEAINQNRLLNITFEGMSNYCPHNCDFCYTERGVSQPDRKLRMKSELSIGKRLSIINQAADLGGITINFIGAGEPTLDTYFWRLIEEVVKRGMIPVVFTEASFRLTRACFTKRLYDLGASLVIKVNSLFNQDYQNLVVTGGRSKETRYFHQRNQAIDLCLDIGFANEDPTRLGIDVIVTTDNLQEIPRIHRYARDRNIFTVMKNYLMTGRVQDKREDQLSNDSLDELWRELLRIDVEEYGMDRKAHHYPFGGYSPCILRSTGVHVSIKGEVFRCDGEEMVVGNLKKESLQDVWARVRNNELNVMGCCPPREHCVCC
ncbi:MAG: radical SAM protein [bacterium]